MRHMYNEQNARMVADTLLERLFQEEAVECTRTESNNVWKFTVKTSGDSEAVSIRQVTWYEFEDETQQFSNGYYASEEDAKYALRTYCKFFL